ncbi:MAG: nitroreductase family protein [Oscillospiraceae bacterium]|nr:nitroreductase family protein [Oscillospiraceae bacterium]
MSFTQLAEQRYSVRKYDSRPIEPEKMEKILNAGRLAPTAKNLQPQRILVVQGEGLETMKECTPCMYGQTAVLVVCYDKNESWKSRSGREIGDVDGGIVMTSMMYQAQDLGIGSLVVGIYKEEPLREKFNIPENYEIVALLMLGYAAEDCVPNEKLHYSRKELSETVSYDSF